MKSPAPGNKICKVYKDAVVSVDENKIDELKNADFNTAVSIENSSLLTSSNNSYYKSESIDCVSSTFRSDSGDERIRLKNHTYMKSIIITFFCAILLASSFASEPVTGMRFKAKLAYGLYPLLEHIIQPYSFVDKTSSFTIETSYRWTNYFEAGIYLGAWRYKDVVFNDELTMGFPVYRPLLFYGVGANFKPVPLIFRKNDFWIDPYISARFGSFLFVNSGMAIKDYREPFDYGIYAGLALYPAKHWGIYGEYGRGNFVDWRAGLCFRF